jgi:hypothetical protein
MGPTASSMLQESHVTLPNGRKATLIKLINRPFPSHIIDFGAFFYAFQ